MLLNNIKVSIIKFNHFVIKGEKIWKKLIRGRSRGIAQGARAPLPPQYILKPFITAAFVEFNACTEILVVIITYSMQGQIKESTGACSPQFPLLAEDLSTLIEQSLTHTEFVIMPILNFK